jgi:hypothetical protein
MHTAMDIDDDDDDNLHQPVPRSFVSKRRQRLAVLREAMWARQAVMTDETWARLIQSLDVYDTAVRATVVEPGHAKTHPPPSVLDC